MTDPIAEASARLVALRDARAAGTLDDAAYEREREAAERALTALLSTPPAPVRPRPSGALALGILAFVAVLAVAGYARTGSPSLAFGVPATIPGSGSPDTAAAAAEADAGASGVGLPQIAAMVEGLATRMKDRPDDAEGWTMLARSYAVLGRFVDAVPAYRRASELTPNDAALLADWADAAAASRGKVDHAEPAELIARALAIDPKQPKALALAGTAAYERGDYDGAIARWRSIVEQLPPGSPVAVDIESSIAEATAKRDGTARAAGAAAAPPTTSAASPAEGSTANAGNAGNAASATMGAAAAAAEAITGTVALSPSVAATVSPGDTVFVFARDASGGRMPLAVQRATVADLPLAFRLDDSMAMAPTARLSGARQLVVGARISRGGGAMPQAGDLSGEAASPVAPGTRGVSVVIDRAVR